MGCRRWPMPPDATLGVWILAGSGALSFSLPITISIAALIAIVVSS